MNFWCIESVNFTPASVGDFQEAKVLRVVLGGAAQRRDACLVFEPQIGQPGYR